ncbi:MAG: glycosyltransferase family 2 protein [Chloroflexaceae bacterium]|nr:glycosyltransferase family 2 protein [Chloroflexaceae bacterium]
MAVVSLLVTLVALALALPLATISAYLLVLAGAACFARRATPLRQGPPATRFLIIVPAHNEELLLPRLLASLDNLDYPRERFAVHVVADNCYDRTADLARAAGACVHERFDPDRQGKGHALQWLLERLGPGDPPYDAIVVVDADSEVSSNFLRVMDARLARGERVIQSYYAARNLAGAPGAGIRAAALILVHYLRPLGRMALGGSAGLKGNGMVFAADIPRSHSWSGALTEDIAYHAALILAGERVTFAPDAAVRADMPGTLRTARSQNERWERGRLDMARAYVPDLLRAALRERSLLHFDAAMELLIPPFGVVAGLSALSLALSIGSANPIALGLSGFAILAQGLYLATGLLLARAPPVVYRALLFAPVFIVWKLCLYARLLLGVRPAGWIRTARNDH